MTPPKTAVAPEPPRSDPAADRAAAVAEAEAAAAQIDQDLKEEVDDEPLVTPENAASNPYAYRRIGTAFDFNPCNCAVTRRELCSLPA